MEKIEVLTEPPQFASLGTISSKYHETLAHGIELNVQQLSKGQRIASLVPPGLHDKVVFLGDDFVQTHLLSFDRAAEVDFHAAVYYSNLHRAKPLTHALAFAGEIALGWLLGGLFATSWKVYGRSRLKMDGLEARSIWDLPQKLSLYLRARGILLVYIILIVTLICFIFVIANWALRSFDIWINPLPIVLGVSIKGLLASRHNALEEHPHSWWSYYNRHPDVIFQIPIIVISIVVVLFFGH